MRLVEPSVQYVFKPEYKEVVRKIELSARNCYKSEDKIGDIEKSEKFIKSLIKRGHHSVLEHDIITLRIICDRGVSHELVRHRIASYSQESTRYVNYGIEGIPVIKPCYLKDDTKIYELWIEAMLFAENTYKTMLKEGATPQEARAVLPNSLKTEIIMTMNIRSWRNFLIQRTAEGVHPQMLEITTMILQYLKEDFKIFFEDI